MGTLLKNQFGYLIGCIERPEDPPGIRKNLFRQNDNPQNVYLPIYLSLNFFRSNAKFTIL